MFFFFSCFFGSFALQKVMQKSIKKNLVSVDFWDAVGWFLPGRLYAGMFLTCPRIFSDVRFGDSWRCPNLT